MKVVRAVVVVEIDRKEVVQEPKLSSSELEILKTKFAGLLPEGSAFKIFSDDVKLDYNIQTVIFEYYDPERS